VDIRTRAETVLYEETVIKECGHMKAVPVGVKFLGSSMCRLRAAETANPTSSDDGHSMDVL
jgi:hypothetical protein